MKMKTGRASLIAAACRIWFLLLALPVAVLAQERVVAIGDVHGAYAEFTGILQRTSLTDGNQKWAGGSATLVQTGDVLDRGAQVRACLDLVMALKQQAGKAHGKVIPLLGNHETLNIMHDLRYVTPAIYATFATERSEKARQKAYQDYLKFLAAHRDHSHAALPLADEPARLKWMEAHPPGFFEYSDAFGPDGKYGRWVRQNRAVVQVGDVIFVHGGLNPQLSFRDLAELDAQVHNDLAVFDALWKRLAGRKIIWKYMLWAEALQHVGEELQGMQARGRAEDADALDEMRKFLALQNCLTRSADGPLWYRGLAQDAEDKLAAGLDALLARLKARYIVDGHTVLSTSEITPRFENRVFLIDTGMNKASYKGIASALEFRNGQITAYYAVGEPKVLVQPGVKKAARTAVQRHDRRVELR